jgi:hypothetical protein
VTPGTLDKSDFEKLTSLALASIWQASCIVGMQSRFDRCFA